MGIKKKTKNDVLDDVDEEQEECDGCRFPGLPLTEYGCSPMSRRKEPRMLCKLCASTFIGNSLEYPEQYEGKDAMQLIGYCTNLILKKLETIERNVKSPRRI